MRKEKNIQDLDKESLARIYFHTRDKLKFWLANAVKSDSIRNRIEENLSDFIDSAVELGLRQGAKRGKL